MNAAYVMINTALGSEEEVKTVLREIEEIKETYIVYGIYDILVKVEYKDKNELRDVIMKKIRRVPNVRSTVTLTLI